MPTLLNHQILHDQSGNTITEFGLIAPAVVTLLLGTMDVGHSLYMRTVIDGAIQEIARDSALEDGAILGKQEAMDYRIKQKILALNNSIDPAEDIKIKRRYYKNFSNAYNAEEEEFVDSNDNDVCDNGEAFTDINENGVWDADGADEGQGGARDVAIVSVSVSYDRLFPIASLIGLPEKVSFSANTVLANQPYAEQAQYGAPATGSCDD
ncbi:MAG: pilus assembly protein [Sphingomonadales bacterium]|jgi:Flp pilus assembly pilin Flp|nr:pilus assembly protein [Sphingomonadales bacterium]MBK9003681.1 pilus assembly protein [Sphingomonadales bacterium]MBK9268855.1 pilus assembly protein [Sphingomonadales bacterium]